MPFPELAASDTMDILLNYNWPGNIRELENTIEYAFIRSKRDDYLCKCCLPPQIRVNEDCDPKLSIKEIEEDEKTESMLRWTDKYNWS